MAEQTFLEDIQVLHIWVGQGLVEAISQYYDSISAITLDLS
jgi:hypothetical protein